MPGLQTSYAQFQPTGYAGMLADMAEWNGLTRTATATIAFGAPVQRNGDTGVAPLTSGEFLGLAKASHLVTGNGDTYVTGDNVPVIDETNSMFGTADAAITVGAAVNWNSTSVRWTTAAVSGAIYAVPGAEADTAASGAGVLFKVRLRRVPS